MNKHSRRLGGVLIALGIAFVVPFIAFAATYIINTNDGAVDGNWSSVTIFTTDGDDVSNNHYDIDQAWVTNQANQSFFYFRVSLLDQLPGPLLNGSIAAYLDCNRDGDWSDSSDVIVYYANSVSYECQGNDWPLCSLLKDSNGAASAEEISGTPYNYEWLADVNNGSVSWAACKGSIDIKFVTLDSLGLLVDSTSVRTYNAPTAVTLGQFSASRGSTSPYVLAAIGLLVGAVALASAGYLRKRFSRS